MKGISALSLIKECFYGFLIVKYCIYGAFGTKADLPDVMYCVVLGLWNIEMTYSGIGKVVYVTCCR